MPRSFRFSRNYSRITGFVVPTLLIALLAFGTALQARLAYADSATIDFENPPYTTGTINGQDGWSSLGAAGSGCAMYDHAVVANTYGYASFGAQSLRISNAVTSGCFGDQTFSKSLADEAGETSAQGDGLSGGTRQTAFEAQWSFASTVPGAEQPGLSVVASPDRGDGARMSWVQMADTPAGLEVNFYDYQESAAPATCDDNDFVFTNLASGLDRTVPHTIKITMHFVDGPANDIVKVYVDGVLKHTGTSWEDYYRNCETNPTRTVDSILFRTGGTAAPATAGQGFVIDNLTLATTTPPGVPTCNNLPATIYVNEQGRIVGGTDNGKVYKGTLKGGNGSDVIVGTDGADKIDGGKGNDTICGGKGNDTIEAQNGADTIFGGDGADRIEGGNDNDTIDGGNGDDRIEGGSGNDTMTGGAGADRFEGNGGDDTATDFHPAEHDKKDKSVEHVLP